MNNTVPLGAINFICSLLKGSLLNPFTSFIERFHSKLSHSLIFRATRSFRCILSESRNKMLTTKWRKEICEISVILTHNKNRSSYHGHSFSSLSSMSEPSSVSNMSPGFTITQSDQCISPLTGTNRNFFLNTLIFLFFRNVQDATPFVPSSSRVVRK